MALKITSSLQTSKGSTSEAYLHISDFRILKNGNAKVIVRWYQSEAERIANDNDTVAVPTNDNIREVYALNLVDINSNVAAAYSEITTLLKAEGHTVESDDTGNWVAI